jgi:hypothetical protein
VHVADALLPSVDNMVGCNISSQLSVKYVERLGFKEQLKQWEKLASEYKSRLPDHV